MMGEPGDTTRVVPWKGQDHRVNGPLPGEGALWEAYLLLLNLRRTHGRNRSWEGVGQEGKRGRWERRSPRTEPRLVPSLGARKRVEAENPSFQGVSAAAGKGWIPKPLTGGHALGAGC